MDLVDIRKWLVKESGRYELVVDTTNWANAGADDYISSGLMLLDDLQNTTHGLGKNLQVLAAGARHIVFGFSRDIKEAWCINPVDSSRWKLKRGIPAAYLQYEGRTVYPPEEVGPPLYFEEGLFRLAPETEQTADVDIPIQYFQTLGNAAMYNGIFIHPVADLEYIIETHGEFYTPMISAETGEVNYWTGRYPHLVVMAAQCIMEMFSRNSEGVKDWMENMRIILTGIDKNLAMDDVEKYRREWYGEDN